MAILENFELNELLVSSICFVGVVLVLHAFLSPIQSKWFKTPTTSTRQKLLCGVSGIVLMAASISVFYQFPIGKNEIGENGAQCSNDLQCDSRKCFPGPHSDFQGSGISYCIAADRHCSLANADGALHDTKIWYKGVELTCTEVGQFVRK
jgi:hypothetical protein